MKTAIPVIIGNAFTGKTNLICRERGFDPESSSTIGAQYVSFTDHMTGRCYHLWDMSGQPRWASYSPNYYYNAQIFIVVFDLTNKQSFADIEAHINRVKQYCKNEPSIILVGNKADLKHKIMVNPDIIDDLIKRLKSRGDNIIGYIQTSALTGEGVDELFNTVINKLEESARLPEVDVTDQEMATIYSKNRSDYEQAVQASLNNPFRDNLFHTFFSNKVSVNRSPAVASNSPENNICVK